MCRFGIHNVDCKAHPRDANIVCSLPRIAASTDTFASTPSIQDIIERDVVAKRELSICNGLLLSANILVNDSSRWYCWMLFLVHEWHLHYALVAHCLWLRLNVSVSLGETSA